MKILEYLFRGIGIITSFSLFMLGLAVTIYSFVDGIAVIEKILKISTKESDVIYSALGVVDLILLALSIFIASIGIFELFVKPIDRLPEWLQVKDIDALKSMLIKVIVVVMAISFMGQVVTWDGQDNILNYGVGIAAVVLALSYFLNVKIAYGEKKDGNSPKQD
jgi:uncharacterized membrane protein YqhA